MIPAASRRNWDNYRSHRVQAQAHRHNHNHIHLVRCKPRPEAHHFPQAWNRSNKPQTLNWALTTARHRHEYKPCVRMQTLLCPIRWPAPIANSAEQLHLPQPWAGQ
jgi:hypothetical protein